jgi:uncharacterized membrane protein YgdD (TMEM256/DUF423 family)
MPLQSSARRFCMLAAVLLALATGHALKGRLTADRYEVLQTAVHYQFFHALGLLGLGLLIDRMPSRGLATAGWLLAAGVILFSGSLYALLAGAPRLFGVLTPIGGVALIIGWCVCALALLRERAH